MPVISEIEHSEVLKVANLLRDGRERVLVQSERLQRLQFSYTINNKSIPKRNRRAEKVGDMQKAGGWGKAHTLARVRTRTNLRRDDLEPIVVAREHADVAQLGDLGRKLGELLARQVEPLNRLRGVSASTCPYSARALSALVFLASWINLSSDLFWRSITGASPGFPSLPLPCPWPMAPASRRTVRSWHSERRGAGDGADQCGSGATVTHATHRALSDRTHL